MARVYNKTRGSVNYPCAISLLIPKFFSCFFYLFFFLCALDDRGELTKDVYYPAQDIAEDLIIVKKNKLDAPFDMVLKTADDFCAWTKELVDKMLEKEWKEPKLELLDELLIKVLRMYFKEDILNG